MPTTIPTFVNVASSAMASPGPSSRGAEQADGGRGFGAMLDRSRAAGTPRGQDGAEAEAPTATIARKPARAGEKKSELSPADVMALLAPYAAPIAPAVIADTGRAALASQGAQTLGANGLATQALPADAVPDAPATAEVPGDSATAAPAGQVAEGGADAPRARASASAASDEALAEGIDKATLPTDATVEGPAAASLARPASTVPAPAAIAAAAAVPEKSATTALADAAASTPAPAETDGIRITAAADASDAGSFEAGTEADSQPLPQLQAPATSTADRAAAPARPTPVLSVAPPVGSDEWAPAIGQQMIRMSASGHQVAELNLNPVGLGPLKVTLTMGDHQAQAQFVSAHESVRKAIEAALPQLRTSLAEQGISLGQASVGAETRQPGQGAAFAQQQDGSRSSGQPAYPGAARTESAATSVATAPGAAPLRRAGTGLDTFA